MVVSAGSARIQLCMATFMAVSSVVSQNRSDQRPPRAGVDLDVQFLEFAERGGEMLGVALVGALALLRRGAQGVADHARRRELLVVGGKEEELVTLEGDVRRAVLLDERVRDRAWALGDLRDGAVHPHHRL